MSRRYKNFIQSLKNMRLEDINDIDITADELNEDNKHEQYNEEDNEFQSPAMGKADKQIHKKHKSFREHTIDKRDPK